MGVSQNYLSKSIIINLHWGFSLVLNGKAEVHAALMHFHKLLMLTFIRFVAVSFDSNEQRNASALQRSEDTGDGGRNKRESC